MSIFNQYKGLRKENYYLFIGKIVTCLGSMIYPVLTLILNQKLGMNATGVATYTIVSGVAILPAIIIGGKLADKYNKKNVIIMCDLVSISLYITCGVIPLSYMTIVFLIIASGFQMIEEPSYDALIADITCTEKRESAYSLLYLGQNIGLVASPTIAGILFNNYLWLSFIISGIAIAFSTILIYTKVKDITPVKQEKDDKYQKERDGESVFRILLENKVILLFMLVQAIYWAVYHQYTYMLPLDMGRIHGENGAIIYGSVASINCIVVVVFTPIITSCFRKMQHTIKYLTGEVLLLTGYVLFLLFLGKVPFYYIAMILFTFGEIFSTISSGPYLYSRIPASHRGRIDGVRQFSHSMIYGILTLYLGMIYDDYGNVQAWMLLFALLGIAILGTLILIFCDRRRYAELYR